MEVVIVEDEKPAARRLERMLAKQNISVTKVLHSVKEAKGWFLSNEHPDLVFLDIQLSDGVSFEIFEDFELKSSVIFTTAYDQYALEAFKLKSIDYLLKPIATEDLESSLAKYKSFIPMESSVATSINQLKELLLNNSVENFKERFAIKIGQHIKLISLKDISCFYSENKSTYILTNEGRSYLLEDSLEKMEVELNPSMFFRINRKYIVKVSSIEDIVAYSNSRLKVKLTNSSLDDLIVSREKVKDFRRWIS